MYRVEVHEIYIYIYIYLLYEARLVYIINTIRFKFILFTS